MECRLESRSQVRACRDQIAYEADRFAERIPVLERNLAQKGPVSKALEESRQRLRFDLSVEQVADSPPPAPSWEASRSILSPDFPEGGTSGNDAARPIEAVGMSTGLWLGARFPGGGRCFALGADEEALQPLFRELSLHGLGVQHLPAGEGTPLPSASGAPERWRPEEGSFGHWCLQTGTEGIGAVLAFVLGPAASDLDLGLLRSRLHPHHVLVLPARSALKDKLLASWDGKVYAVQDYLLFTDPGARQLNLLAPGASPVLDIQWPRISVVTVSFNQARFLEDCLLSVLEQDYPNLEYIVVDACSTDGSQEILQRYSDRIDKLVIEPDEGQSDGLNKGLGLAGGEILTWVNSDDLLRPGALKRVALTFLSYDCDLVAGGCERVTEDTSHVIARHHSALPIARELDLGLQSNLMWHESWEKGDYFFQPEVFFSADIWRRAGGFLKRHLYWAMDYELWIRMAMAGARVVHIPEVLAGSRMHDDQKTTSEELYIYQLRNILMEYDDLLAILERASDLPEGPLHPEPRTAVQAPLVESTGAAAAQGSSRRSLAARLWRLRHPTNLAAALKRRLPGPLFELLRRLWRLRKPGTLARAIDRRLPEWARSLARSILRRVRYSSRGVRIVGGVRLKALEARSEMLSSVIAEAQTGALRQSLLQSELSALREHLADVKSAFERAEEGFIDSLHDATSKAASLSARLGEVETLHKAEQAARRAELEAHQAERSRLEEAHGIEVAARRAELEAHQAEQSRLEEAHGIELAAREEAHGIELAARRAELEAHRAEKSRLDEAYGTEVTAREAAEAAGRAERDSHKAERNRLAADAAGYLTQALFGPEAAKPLSKSAAKLILEGSSMKEAVGQLLESTEFLKRSHGFDLVKSHLAMPRRFPIRRQIGRGLGQFTIVDVGSEELAMENDIYAPLANKWKCRIFGFDPFREQEFASAVGPENSVEAGSRHYEVTTLPNFVGNGRPATFHVNLFRPTSSLKATNHSLVDRFGLLGEALRTVETFEVETRRLDDLLAPHADSQRYYDFLKVDVQGFTLEILKGAKRSLSKALVCHLEAEFAEVYRGEKLFSEIDDHMTKAGFELIDLWNQGRERYGAYEGGPDGDFHAGRLLWADCIYMRRLDRLDDDDPSALLRMAVTAHEIYRKYDLAAELLKAYDRTSERKLLPAYLKGL